MNKQKRAALAARFHALFAGLERGYGTYNNIDKLREDGKRTGTADMPREPVTDELWEDHLEGVSGLGIVPIRDDSTCLFGALDVDVYADLDHGKIAGQFAQLGIPVIPCRSKSGGLHGYLFCKTPVPAAKMQERLRDIAARLGHGNCEIFPKQTRLAPNDMGSFINMPYFGGDDTNRYAVKPNGDAYTMEEFLAAAEAAKVDADFFDQKAAKGKEKAAPSKGCAALPDGPPCLQHLIELGFPEGTRNTGLFQLGTYYRKARPTDWQQCIEDANQKFIGTPLPSDEVQTIIGSLGRGNKEFHYACSKHPLAPHCNAVVCRSRKYGVGGGGSAFPMLGQLRKLLTAPPVWFLDVTTREGDVVALEMTTDDLQDASAFQRQCIERLDMMPQMPSKVVWQQTINQLLENVHKLDPPPDDATTEGQFWGLLEQFCTGRTQAQSKEEILLGKPYTEEGRTYFRTEDLLAFLTRKQFKEYKIQQIAKLLKMRKDENGEPWASHGFERMGRRGANLWSIPEYGKRDEQVPVAEGVDKEKDIF